MPFVTASQRAESAPTPNVLLWTVQGLLALLFLFAGIVKLMMPLQVLAQQTGMPGPFMRFIAIAELLGALGLILPGLVGVKRSLTPLAAAGLVTIMIGATVVTAATHGVGPAVLPLVVGLLAATVMRGRRQWARSHAFVSRPVDYTSARSMYL